jgi:hypothetical protein
MRSRTPAEKSKRGARPIAGFAASWLLAALMAAALAWPPALRAEDALQREYEIKAAFLYNFIRYIDWPSDATVAPGGIFTIGIVGDTPVGPVFSPLNKKQIKGCTVVVKEVSSAKDLEDCQVVFICASEKARVTQILGELKDSRALTVSEINGFAEQGGIINFFSERNKVRFEINPEAAHRLGLTISSDLLKLAKLVKS